MHDLSSAALLRIRSNPLPDADAVELWLPPGRTVASCVPDDLAAPVMVSVDGHWLPRRVWDHELQVGQVIEVHVVVQGGDGGSDPLRIVLMIALIVVANVAGGAIASAYFGGSTVAASIATSAIVFAGSLAINAILPAEGGAASNQEASSPTYNVALSGNQARLGQVIPDLYGYNTTFPDFAAQPYNEFQPNPDGGDDAYYCALFCLGHGSYEIRKVAIDDTPIDSFADAEYAILEPGEQPTMVLTNVVTSPEVAGQTITSGRFIGPYTLTKAGQFPSRIDVDIVFQGLARAEADGDLESVTVDLRFEVRTVNEFGSAISGWRVLGTESIRGSTLTPIRRTFRYTMPAPLVRVQFRAVRVDLFEDNARVYNTPLLSAVRAVLAQVAPLQETATHLEVRIRATDQLSGLSQRRFSVTSLRKLNTYTTEGGLSFFKIPTRNPAWALLNKWTDPIAGDGLPLSRLNLPRLIELAQLWDERQDRFDFAFDTRLTSIEADQLIAGVGRAAVIERLGRLTVVRDEWRTVPRFQFGARSITPDSLSIDYVFPQPDVTPDGVVVEYFDVYANDFLTIDCPAPGVVTMLRPQTVRLLGIRGPTHAKREGVTLAAIAAYRRKFFTWSTELLGSLPAYGTLVQVAPALQGFAKSGDVVHYRADDDVLVLSEPVTFTGGEAHFVSITREDGTLRDPIPCGPGPDEFSVTLLAELTDPPTFSASDRERVKFIFGTTAAIERNVSIRSIDPTGQGEGGTPLVTLSGVVDDIRVHQADAPWLPSGAEQDPITDTGGGGGGGPGEGSLVVVDMPSTYYVRRSHPYTTGLPRFTMVGLRFNIDGSVQQLFGINTDGTQPGAEQVVTSVDEKQNRWDRFAPHEAGVGALYAIRFRVSRYYPPEDADMVEGSAFDAWLPLSAAREIRMYFDEGNLGNHPFLRGSNELFRRARVSVDIREAATGTIQDSAIAELFNELQDFIPGGE